MILEAFRSDSTVLDEWEPNSEESMDLVLQFAYPGPQLAYGSCQEFGQYCFFWGEGGDSEEFGGSCDFGGFSVRFDSFG